MGARAGDRDAGDRPQGVRTREAFDAALGEAIEKLAPDLILLAGFMRVFTPGFIARFPQRILNIHPSLLPSFPDCTPTAARSTRA
jgi:phosphoribosylglycinamide formyltransferase-1